ncbi:hypothetical protein [Streptomyces yangpuensis]|uniref:hypothetical protein n=1 Tax=Streptomyces yangpuensis TaxID=1648182 RepID=UPI0036C28C14
MSTTIKPSSRDERFAEVFGAPLDQLLAAPEHTRHLREALELRAFLAVAEQHVARVRDRVHDRSAPDRPMDELSEDNCAWTPSGWRPHSRPNAATCPCSTRSCDPNHCRSTNAQ